MLNISRKNIDDIVVSKFSSETKQFCSWCLDELSSAYVPTKNRLNYFIRNGSHFHLYSSLKSLGYLSKEDEEDITFKRFISSLYNDVGDFYAVVFPIDVNWFPYFGEIVVYKTEESFAKTLQIIKNRVKIKTYDSYGNGFALSDIGFNMKCNYDDRYKRLEDMILSCNGNIYATCKRLNESKVGYTNWKVVEDTYNSQKLQSIDDLGNIRYLEILL